MIYLLLNILTYRNNNKKLCLFLSNICYGVHYYLVKFKLKTPPMYGEIIKEIVLEGNLK